MASRLVALELPGPAGALEALLQERDDAPPAFVALVCHPHPLYGGTLHSKVVHRIAATLHELGATTLRFNFRGVGRSAGRHGGGPGEVEDARAALAWLRERVPGAPATVAGFSFGAAVAAHVAAGDAGVARLVMVAPPVGSTLSVLATAPVPKLVVQGTADTTCPPADLERVFPSWASPKRIERVEGATHFFDRRLADLGEALHRGLAALG